VQVILQNLSKEIATYLEVNYVNDKIAVLYGGVSSEREVSLKTGTGIYNALIKKGYKNTILIDVGWDITEKLLEESPDFVI